MKKLLFIFFYCLIAIMGMSQTNPNDSSNSRKVKALVIIYDITYPNSKPILKSIYYNKRIVMIYGSKINTTSYIVNGGITSSISNDCNESCYTLYPNQKFMLKIYRNDKVPEYGGAHVNQTTSLTNESMHILGFDCNVYKISTLIQVNTYTTNTETYLYTYDKLENFNKNYTNNKGISGIVIGSDIDFSQGCIERSRAISVTEQFVDSTMFELPINYSVYTNDEYYQKLTTDKSFQKEMNKEFGINDQFQTASKWKTFFDILLDVTPKIANIATNYANNYSSSNIQNNTTTNNTLVNTTSDCSTLQQMYSTQKKYAHDYIIRLAKLTTNDDIYGKVGKDYATTPNPALNVETLKSLKETQKLMRILRERAEKNGCNITKADEEDWTM